MSVEDWYKCASADILTHKITTPKIVMKCCPHCNEKIYQVKESYSCSVCNKTSDSYSDIDTHIRREQWNIIKHNVHWFCGTAHILTKETADQFISLYRQFEGQADFNWTSAGVYLRKIETREEFDRDNWCTEKVYTTYFERNPNP